MSNDPNRILETQLAHEAVGHDELDLHKGDFDSKSSPNAYDEPLNASSAEDLKAHNEPVEGDDEQYQTGVKQMRAITAVWSKTSLIGMYACMFSVYLVRAFQNQITSNLGAFIVSDFEAHSLIPVIGIVSSVMGAATYMTQAKFLNLFDRSYGFLVMSAIAIVGMILSAVCTNIETYCAAQVFSSVGFTGMIFSIDVITIDTSSLKDRGLAYAFTSFPYVITAFSGPVAAEKFRETNWRWGYGIWAIILPVVVMPLFAILQYNKKKARELGVLVEHKSQMTWTQAIVHYTIEFDLLGVILLAGGLVVFLLPFSLAGYTADDWKAGHIIAMIVVGILSLLAFGVVEKYVAPVPFLPFKILANRTLLATCVLDALYQIAYYCWSGYFTSFLQVVFNVSVAQAGWISSTFDVVSGVWLLVVGFAIRKTGYFRWIWMGAIPLYILGSGLMIHFRQPGQSVGYVIMCQIFIALAGGAMIICQQVSVLATADHNNAAAALALLGLFGNSGGALGGTISGAVWTHTFPNALAKYLPEENLPDLDSIYESLDVQLSYEIGSAARDAIIHAYGDAQTKMLIAGTAVMSLSLGLIFLVRNIKVSEIEQVKGMLF